jgi:3-deoxy-7-phosphoheptulonate synthase
MAEQNAPAIGAVTRDGGMTLIAGPCSVESREQMHEVAACLSELGIKVMRGGAYKPRTSPFSFQGLEHKGLELLREAADAYGLLVVTEVTDSAHAEAIAECADMIQIGTRNMANFSLLKKVGEVTAESGKPVVFKRGMVDVSHPAGQVDLVPALARASVAVGADGIMVEVHPNPREALCDGPQSLDLDQFAALVADLRTVAAAVGTEVR